MGGIIANPAVIAAPPPDAQMQKTFTAECAEDAEFFVSFLSELRDLRGQLPLFATSGS
jgi:hypothetical protein